MSLEKKGSKILPVAIILLIIGIVIGGIGGYATTAGQISIIQNRIQDLETQVTALQTDKAQLQSQVTSLQDDKVRLQNTIDELNASLASRTKSDLAILATLFSPKGGAASQVIYWLGKANKSVHVLIYSFTLDSIGDAVLRAYQKGIDVKVVFEGSQVSKYSEYFRLADAGVQVRNDTNPGLMHHKVAIIDSCIILVGSFNWSNDAEEDNNENLLVIRSKELASTFDQEFKKIWSFGR